MAAKVRGITIEIGGDASGLDKALKDVNSSIKNTQSQLKDVNKLLKFDPGNAELLAQKQRLLAEQSEQTAKKLEILKKAAKQTAEALEAGEVGEEQYEALQREIASCEVDMRKLKDEADKTNDAISNSGKGLTDFANGVSSVADATKTLSKCADDIVNGLYNMTINAASSADSIMTLSKQTGLATSTIQKMQYAAEQIDVPFENIEGAVRKLKGNLDSQEDTLNRIGVSVKDSANSYRNIEDIFNDTVVALGEIENETERDKVAMDLFGRSADELAGLLDDGGKAFRTLGEEAENRGLLISEEELAAANELNDAIDSVRTSFSAAFGKLGTQLASKLVPVFEKLGVALNKVADIVAKIPTPVMVILTVLLLIVAAISPLLSGIASFIIVVPAIVSGIGAINAALATLLANPVTWIIAGIVVALVALGVIIYQVAKHWDEISEAATNAMNKIKETIENTSIFQHFKQDLSEVKSAFENAGGGLKGVFAGALSYVKNSFESVFQAITGLSDKQMQAIENKVISTFNAIVDAIKNLPNTISNIFNNIRTTIENAITNAFNYLVNKAKDWGSQLADNFTSGIRKMVDSVKDSLKSVIDVLDNIINKQNKVKNETPSSGGGGGGYSSYSSYQVPNYNQVTSYGSGGASVQGNYATVESINSLTKAINEMSSNTNVNVVLQGDAKGVFKLVRQENAKMINATGFHALA